MSLSTHYMRKAARRSALQAARCLRIEETRAMRLSPIPITLILHALRRNSTIPFAPSGLRFALHRCTEDVLKDPNRLYAADVRARGDAIFQTLMGRHSDRAVKAVASLMKVDARRARTLLAISAVAAVSALYETKRELNLSTAQTLGVLISESALAENVEPALMIKVRDWVFRPTFLGRLLARADSLLRRRRQPASA